MRMSLPRLSLKCQLSLPHREEDPLLPHLSLLLPLLGLRPLFGLQSANIIELEAMSNLTPQPPALIDESS